jgi:hypothetical protein
MRFFCREDHDELDDRCPPHEFHGALWDDIGANASLSVLFCTFCGDVRPLAVPSLVAPELESVTSEPDAG